MYQWMFEDVCTLIFRQKPLTLIKPEEISANSSTSSIKEIFKTNTGHIKCFLPALISNLKKIFKTLNSSKENILKFTWQPGGQPDMV